MKSGRVLLVPVRQWQSWEPFFPGKTGSPWPIWQKGLEVTSFLNLTARNMGARTAFPLPLTLVLLPQPVLYLISTYTAVTMCQVLYLVLYQ